MKSFVVIALLVSSSPQILANISSVQSRITNGKIANEKQFPYQAGLRINMEKSSIWCGGTLISNQWILTAAHCIDSCKPVKVYLGAVDRSNLTEPGKKIIDIDKKNMIVHKGFNRASTVNDIALIKLPSPVELNDYIKPAKLPKKNGNYSDYTGVEAIASGWGRTSDKNTGGTAKFRWVKVPIANDSDCSKHFKGTSKKICINTKGGKSACSGDSGGPLVLADGSNIVIGVASLIASSRCEIGDPAAYTRVTSYLDWIAKESGVVNK